MTPNTDQRLLSRAKSLNGRVPELWGVKEVSEFLGTKPGNLDSFSRLPPPALHIAAGRFWRADLVRAYLREREAGRITNARNEGRRAA